MPWGFDGFPWGLLRFLPRKKNLSSAICPIRFGGGLLIGVEGVEGFLGVECGGARIAFGFL